MDLNIAGRTALVFGAGGGLGGAIARALAAEGVKVAAADIALAPARDTVADIEAAGGTALAVGWDIGDLGVAAENLDRVRAALGEVAILVNMTGGPPPSTAAGVPTEVWTSHFQSMVAGVIGVTDLVLPAMRAAGWGRIITSTSSGVIAPIPNLGVSNALRAALVGWSKTLAGEVGRDGITANVILPGRIATGRITQLDEARAQREGRTVDDVQQASTATIPLGRYGRPDEYGAAATFLAGEGASYITGSVIRVDGGLIPSI
ncbi:MAG TPA: SDR family oxidoreductase [Baekduia sp.]